MSFLNQFFLLSCQCDGALFNVVHKGTLIDFCIKSQESGGRIVVLNSMKITEHEYTAWQEYCDEKRKDK